MSKHFVILLSTRSNNLLSFVLSDPSFNSEPIIVSLAGDLVRRERYTLLGLLRRVFSYINVLRAVLRLANPIENTYIISEVASPCDLSSQISV